MNHYEIMRIHVNQYETIRIPKNLYEIIRILIYQCESYKSI